MKFLKAICLIFCLFQIFSCNKSKITESKDFEITVSNPIEVSFCELANNPEKYSGQKVLLIGVYMLRFERSSFYSPNCNPAIWFVADFNAPPCNEKSEIEAWDWSSAMLDRAHGVVIVGSFENKIIKGHSTGELSEFYRFKVDCINKIKQLGAFVVYPESQAKIVKKRIEDFEKSKY